MEIDHAQGIGDHLSVISSFEFSSDFPEELALGAAPQVSSLFLQSWVQADFDHALQQQDVDMACQVLSTCGDKALFFWP